MAKKDSYLGVDLSYDSIKVVELANQKDKPKLVTYGYTETPAGVFKGDFIENKNKTSTLIKEICQKSKVTTQKTLTALPNSVVFSTIISLHDVLVKDAFSPQKIKKMIAGEFAKIAPLPIEEMFFIPTLIDVDILEKAKQDKQKKVRTLNYLVVSASLKIIKRYTDIFNQAGLDLVKIDIEAFCQVRSLIGRDPSNMMLIDIGENLTSIVIVSKRLPILKRTLQLGGGNFTKHLADQLKINPAEAEQYKLDLAINYRPGGDFPEIMQIPITPIINEVKYLQKIYADKIKTDNRGVEKIILTGGGSLIPNLSTYLSNNLNIPVYLGDPWARVIYPEELFPVLSEIGPRFSVAIGLAMEEILK